MPVDDAPVLDPSVLETLRLLNEPGQPDVLQEVLGLFLSDAPARVEAIVAAVDARDPAALQKSAHTLKGAAGSIGALALQRACRALEEMGTQHAIAHAAEGVQALTREYARVKNAIDQLL